MSGGESLVLPIIAFEGATAFAVRTPSYTRRLAWSSLYTSTVFVFLFGVSFFLPK